MPFDLSFVHVQCAALGSLKKIWLHALCSVHPSFIRGPLVKQHAYHHCLAWHLRALPNSMTKRNHLHPSSP